ncbi:MAG: insulinase family protein [Candidatus Eisenbacteria bacterium]|uniref:Insulinase family protein n=1 Tax=Eiseniibacteriota bacterium TaxID=2212470 RepID=A0A9D6L7X1_UNCEI|nr:insulinase family protein [Candidatus Eisenbacteria bacterium]MBI3539494.1 insulinase family protein [Candidatus Eisenbacteria bacterium]
MNRRVRLALLSLASILCIALAPRTTIAAFAPDTLTDSTWTARWKLANGLDVSVRDIPGCPAVAMVMAFRAGRDLDPKGREGLADLAAEVYFTGPTGVAPERTRKDLDSIRPLGWNLQVTPRFSLIAEVARKEQFPAVLREMAARLAGVTVTDSLMAHARRTVNAEQAQKYLVQPDLTLYNRLRDVALGLGDAALLQRVSGRATASVTAAEMHGRLKTLYVPANATLALAGDFAGVDLPALMRNLFGAIPAGAEAAEPPPPHLTATKRVIPRPGLAAPLGVAGVIAPAITDSLSPDFYMNCLLIGHYCEDRWGPAQPPIVTRFKYSIFADPQLAQFFPPVRTDENDADQLGVGLQDGIEILATTIIEPRTYHEIRVNHQWVLGGPLSPGLVQRCREHPGTLFTIANTLAVRALWGDAAFWKRYLDRFMSPSITGGGTWTAYFQSPDNIVRMLLVPAKR